MGITSLSSAILAQTISWVDVSNVILLMFFGLLCFLNGLAPFMTTKNVSIHSETTLECRKQKHQIHKHFDTLQSLVWDSF